MKRISYTATDGEKYSLQESHRMIVLRTKKGIKLSAAITTLEGKAVLKKFRIKEFIEKADVYILQIKKSLKDPLALRNEARKIFKKEEKLRFAGRVFVNAKSRSWVLYTENIFIKFNSKIPAKKCIALLKRYKLKIKEKIKFSAKAWFAEPTEENGQDVFKICRQLFNRKEIDYCEPELIRKPGKKSVAPKIHTRQWHLKSTVIGKRKISAGVSADIAHKTTKGEKTTIAIIDDGVDIHHVEFNQPGKIVWPRDISLNSTDPMPKNRDDNHGTCCAGVACAAGINKACGVAPLARLMPIRCISYLGSKDEAFAIVHAVDKGADVISCSWGPEDGDWWSTRSKLHGRRHPISPLTNDAINYAVKKGRKGKGCIIVFAAGNGNETCDPDKYISHPEIIAVSACNDRGKKSVYSDYGKCVWVCFPSDDYKAKNFRHPAPLTTGIWTTDRVGKKGHKQKHFANYTADFGGTSSACPGVAGVCALILSANSKLTYKQVKDILRLTADKIDPEKGNYNENGHSEKYGYGRVNAAKAVELAGLIKK